MLSFNPSTTTTILSTYHISSPPLGSRPSVPPCGLLKMRMNEVWQRRSGSSVPMYLPSITCTSPPLLQCLAAEPKDCLGSLHSLAAERPGGLNWALQAGILSIRPLQATLGTGDASTDLLCLSVYCWASAWGGPAGLTGACANLSSIFASSSTLLKVFSISPFNPFPPNLKSLLWSSSLSQISWLLSHHYFQFSSSFPCQRCPLP